MKCHDCKNYLMAWFDQELDQKQRQQMQEHLKQCSRCRDLEQSMQSKILTPLRTCAKQDAPDRVWEQIAQQLESAEAVRVPTPLQGLLHWLKPLRPALAGALSFVILILLITTVWLPNQNKQETELADYLINRMHYYATLSTTTDVDQVTQSYYFETAIESVMLSNTLQNINRGGEEETDILYGFSIEDYLL